jgi:hypothetical protein
MKAALLRSVVANPGFTASLSGAHKVRVWINSNPGKRATVTIELPVHRSSPSIGASQLPTMSEPDPSAYLNG